ncbi:hypothetical protein BJ508DRAFT_330198 [Ascobolus immersus RN42]|uniref:Uncharacterized protein n=1 Tax=Ascobolus immersus RN42 TaxID=1160509 RepID=A0A3N4HUD3_ASCIM|nr:hypothetical protein BJ508DRAFT_330198 [Ascobolus immersus RN42]
MAPSDGLTPWQHVKHVGYTISNHIEDFRNSIRDADKPSSNAPEPEHETPQTEYQPHSTPLIGKALSPATIEQIQREIFKVKEHVIKFSIPEDFTAQFKGAKKKPGSKLTKLNKKVHCDAEAWIQAAGELMERMEGDTRKEVDELFERRKRLSEDFKKMMKEKVMILHGTTWD